MGGYVAFGDVRSLALWERLVHAGGHSFSVGHEPQLVSLVKRT